MPIITLKIGIEDDNKTISYKHFLNHENYFVHTSKEDDKMFSMYIKKPIDEKKENDNKE